MGARKRMPNGAAAEARDSVRLFPGLETLADEKKPHWLFRTAVWSGVIMATPEKPNGWQISPAVITLALVIAGMVASGGYYMGLKDAENRQIMERLAAAERDAKIAKELGLAKSSEVGHTPTPEKK